MPVPAPVQRQVLAQPRPRGPGARRARCPCAIRRTTAPSARRASRRRASVFCGAGFCKAGAAGNGTGSAATLFSRAAASFSSDARLRRIRHGRRRPRRRCFGLLLLLGERADVGRRRGLRFCGCGGRLLHGCARRCRRRRSGDGRRVDRGFLRRLLHDADGDDTDRRGGRERHPPALRTRRFRAALARSARHRAMRRGEDRSVERASAAPRANARDRACADPDRVRSFPRLSYRSQCASQLRRRVA